MPGFDRTGPEGRGAMSGRGLGACADGRLARPGNGKGTGQSRGRGMGFGHGCAVGPGRGLGWFNAGYAEADAGNATIPPAGDIKSALEARTAFLRAELARNEALLQAASSEDAGK